MVPPEMINTGHDKPAVTTDIEKTDTFIISISRREKRNRIEPPVRVFMKAIYMLLNAHNKEEPVNSSFPEMGGIQNDKNSKNPSKLDKPQIKSAAKTKLPPSTPLVTIDSPTRTESDNVVLTKLDTLADNLQPVVETLPDEIGISSEIIDDAAGSTVEIITEDLESKSSTVTDVILPIAATAGMVAGTVALFYVTAKGKLDGIAVRVQQAIPLIVRTPETLLSHGLNQDIEAYTLPALNEALRALTAQLIRSTEDADVATAVSESADTEEDQNSPPNPKNKFVLSPFAARK